MKKVVITQSNYIPWKGYFDAIAIADEFVLYDDMQYTKRDWRNRNIIKTEQGLKWLTIPVEVSGKYFQKINETVISDKNWNIHHLNQLKQTYKKANCYNQVIDWVEDLYTYCTYQKLTEINQYFLEKICDFLAIKHNFKRSESFVLAEEKTERLVNICVDLQATHYYSGPAAKDYMNEEMFSQKNIQVHYFNYSGYEPYNQLYNSFEHGVSILDIIFNEGVNAKLFLKNTNK